MNLSQYKKKVSKCEGIQADVIYGLGKNVIFLYFGFLS